jgi:hypothetical protein
MICSSLVFSINNPDPNPDPKLRLNPDPKKTKKIIITADPLELIYEIRSNKQQVKGTKGDKRENKNRYKYKPAMNTSLECEQE